MKSPFQRIAALALCFTLTLGAFAYRPSEAKAIAGVDDAVVIGALLSAFAGGCGLIFSNNGMTSSELAQGLTNKWNEYKAAVLETDTTFAGWLGYEDMDALLQAIVLSGGNALTVPRLVARKFTDFTTWLTQNLGVTAGGEEKAVSSVAGGTYVLSDGIAQRIQNTDLSAASPSSCFFFKIPQYGVTDTYMIGSSGSYIDVHVAASTSETTWLNGKGSYVADLYVDGKRVIAMSFSHSFRAGMGYASGTDQFFWITDYNGNYVGANGELWQRNGFLYKAYSRSFMWEDLLGYPIVRAAQPSVGVQAPAGVQTPDLADEKDTPVGITGVGDGTATSIEELLKKILEQLQANTLAPTLDLAGTQTGGNTGTDEDAKPYLPYIPQIFEKIKELPGTLANIWESIKGIPAAIAEKIGAFFTTLWGWLQNIIDAITALPAAIAEKIGALFKPDEALFTEITDTFKGKFGFFSTLKQFGNDLFGMTPETEPPVIWVHLENAESKFGYNYGDKQKIFDMTWYQKYKASVDGLLSGFLWLGYLWLLFKRAPAILGGMQLSADDAPRSADMPDVLSSPRLGAGDGSTMYRGDGFTMRDKGGRSK